MKMEGGGGMGTKRAIINQMKKIGRKKAIINKRKRKGMKGQ
jgi:hypothetical protein